MKNQWTNYLKGYVKVKVTGRLIEQFLNHCVRENITVWEIKRLNNEEISGYLKLDDVKKVRHLIRQYECKLSFKNRNGFPFFIPKMIRNSGFVSGIISFLIIVLLLSNMVWNIEIEGAKPDTEYQLENTLEEIGIKPGKFQFLLPSLDEIQRDLTSKLDMISWIGVDIRGTTFHFEVVEKKEPEKPKLYNPRHLVSKKKGVIYDYFIEEGQPLIEINDFVNKGDILVSGIIGKEGNTEIVAAKGTVYGEVWYKSNVTVPLKTTFNVFTGETKTKHQLSFSSFTLPFWGFGENKFSEYEIQEYNKPLYFWKWELPLAYQKKIIREKEVIRRQYNQGEAEDVAMKMAKKELKDHLEEESTIKGEKVLRKSIENGKVKLTIHYQVIEDIAVEQPIIQGD